MKALSYRQLIPDVANGESWRRYFSVDMIRALGYCRKVLALRDFIVSKSSDPIVKKIIVGIVGRDTVGHCKDVQTLFRRFFGILCRGCGKAVKSVAMGIQFEKVAVEVSIEAVDLGLTEDIKALELVLGRITSGAVNVEKAELDKAIKRMAGNPLEIFRLVKGFYSVNISLLPLYNPNTFFIYTTRSSFKSILRMFYPNIDFSVLSKYGLVFREIRICRDDSYTMYIHDDNSTAKDVNTFVEMVYRLIRRSLGLGLSRFFGLDDEEKRFILKMLPEAKKLEGELQLKRREIVFNLIKKGLTATRISPAYIYAKADVVFSKDSDTVTIGSIRTTCRDFVEALTPYIVTGLAYLKDVSELDSTVKAKLYIYYPRSSTGV